MKLAALSLLVLLAAPPWWRESNSHREALRGSDAYERGAYDDAARAYTNAFASDPSAISAFNAGTAAIAAGQAAEGAALLEKALVDPALRADAYYNRGNSALAAGTLDRAVADYIAALRANPRHAAAKRNLEIALQRQRQQQQSKSGEEGGNDGSGNQQPTPAAGQQQQPARGALDVEALLRSVQQHEQEELRRLKGQPAEGKVGW